MIDPSACVDCGAPLPDGHRYRCVACVEAAMDRIAATPPGRPVPPSPRRPDAAS
jgi:hypothetical protein